MFLHYVDGKRTRKFFATREDAEKEAKAVVSQKKHLRAVTKNFTNEDYREFAEAKQIIGAGVSLVECALFWKSVAPMSVASLMVPDAVSTFLATKEKLGSGKDHLTDLKHRMRAFSERFSEKKVAEVHTADLLAWLQNIPLRPRSVRNYWGAVQNFFRWCQRKHWIPMVPLVSAKEDLPKIPHARKGVFTVSQVRGIMQWVAQNHPDHAPWFALQVFCGLRNAEASKMRWEWIDAKRRRIVIPAEICKTDDDWVLQSPALPETIWAWLGDDIPKEGKIPAISDKTITDWRQKMIAAGVIPKWPGNALRHTFCTMHISLENNAEKTAVLLRHQSSRMLYKSYLGALALHEEAVVFFGIKPTR